MKPLQTPVLLGVSGLDPLWHYPQLDPPCGQWCEASQPQTSEGRPVVGADDVGQAVLSESPIQYALNLWTGGALQTVAHQQVPRHGVLGRQGINAHSIVGPEPALEVDGPDVVGALGVGKGFAPACSPTSSLVPPYQTSTVQYAAGRGGGRPGHVGIDLTQPSDYLLRAPCGTGALLLDDALSYLCGCGVGVVMRSPAQVEQTTFAVGLIPTDQLVAGLATDPELSAQLGNSRLPRRVALDEL